MSRLRTIGFRLVAAMLPLVATVAIGEVALRLFSDRGFSLLVKDVDLGQRYRPGFEGEVFVPEADREVALRFNRLGFRGPDRTSTKPPGVRRLVLLGDSYIAALAVAERDMMATRLEALLNGGSADAGSPIGAPGERWQVLAFGVSGYSTGQSLLVWRQTARDFDPDVVALAFTVSNDLGDNSRETSGAHRPYFDLGADGGLVLHRMNRLRTGLSVIAGRSRFYNWLKDAQRKARKEIRSTIGQVDSGWQIMNTEPPPEIERAWTITRRLLVQLRDEVTATGARFCVVTVPYAPQYDERWWRELVDIAGPEEAPAYDPDYPERRLARMLAEEQIPALSLLPAFRRERPNGLLNFLEGRAHWNEDGNRLAAEETYRFLLEEGWVEPASSPPASP